MSTNFGLINRTYEHDAKLAKRHEGEDHEAEETAEDTTEKTQWQRFESQVRALNSEADASIRYKVLYLGRHGEGFHNVAQSWYGDEAWDVGLSVLSLIPKAIVLIRK